MTVISTSEGLSHFYVAALRGQLRILHAGMKIKGLSKTQALNRTSLITKETYKRGQLQEAAADLTIWLDSHRKEVNET